MRPTKLTLRNYRAFEQAEINLAEVTAAAIIGVNGAGKSALVEAITWALYGDSRSSGVDGVVRIGASEASVELEFEHVADLFRVIRKRSLGRKSDLQLLVKTPEDGDNWRPLAGGVTEAQRVIDSMLAMDAKLFRVTSCVGQGDSAGICDATPSERKAAIYRILEDRLGKFPALAERAKARVKDCDARVLELRTRRSGFEEAAAELESIGQEAADARDRMCLMESEGADLDKQLAAEREKLTAAEAALAKHGVVAKAYEDVRAESSGLRLKRMQAEDAQKSAGSYLTQMEEARVLAESADTLEADVERWQELYDQAAEINGKRQEAERKCGEELRAVDSKHQAVRDELRAALNRLSSESTKLDRDVKHTTELRDTAAKQAEIAGSAPCGEMIEQCPIAANVRGGAARLEDLTAALGNLNDKVDANDGALGDASDAEEKNSQEWEAAKAAISDKRTAEVESLTEQIKALGYSVDGHNRAKAEYAQARQARESLGQIAAMQTKLEHARAEIEEIGMKLVEVEAKEAGLKAEVESLPYADPTIHRNRIHTLEGGKQALQLDINEANRELARCEERARVAQEAKEKLAPIDSQIRQSDHQREIFAILQEAFGRDGIPALIIDNVLPLIEDRANEVLSRLSDGRMSVKLVSQKLLGSGGIAETLDIVISDRMGERAYEDWSGGEKLRVDLAIRVALGRLLAARNAADIDLLILDEVCAPLDQQGEDALVDCIERLMPSFGCILLITHRESLRDRLPQQIVVTADAGGSRAILL